MSPAQRDRALADLDLHRDALALVGAAQNGDTDGVLAVLARVDQSDIVQFLAALGGMVAHALATPPEAGWSGFLASYATAIDTTAERVRRMPPEDGT